MGEKEGATDNNDVDVALYTDLTDIVSLRRYTLELYRAALLCCSSCDKNDDGLHKHPETQPRHHQHHQQQLQAVMTRKIDEYMVHPTTCTRRVYASSIYDRLLELYDNNNSKDDNNTSLLLEKYIQKLFKLATSNS